MFNAPIPGESLTTTPKNMPYENPPQIVDPDEALAFHMDKLSDVKRLDSAMQLLENDISIQTLVEGILRAGVASGIHTVDVSLIIAPVIHEYLKETADVLEIDYVEGEDFNEDSLDEIQIKAGKSIASDEPIDIDDDGFEEELIEEEVEEEIEVPQRRGGLMSRPEGV